MSQSFSKTTRLIRSRSITEDRERYVVGRVCGFVSQSFALCHHTNTTFPVHMQAGESRDKNNEAEAKQAGDLGQLLRTAYTRAHIRPCTSDGLFSPTFVFLSSSAWRTCTRKRVATCLSSRSRPLRILKCVWYVNMLTRSILCVSQIKSKSAPSRYRCVSTL